MRNDPSGRLGCRRRATCQGATAAALVIATAAFGCASPEGNEGSGAGLPAREDGALVTVLIGGQTGSEVDNICGADAGAASSAADRDQLAQQVLQRINRAPLSLSLVDGAAGDAALQGDVLGEARHASVAANGGCLNITRFAGRVTLGSSVLRAAFDMDFAATSSEHFAAIGVADTVDPGTQSPNERLELRLAADEVKISGWLYAVDPAQESERALGGVSERNGARR